VFRPAQGQSCFKPGLCATLQNENLCARELRNFRTSLAGQLAVAAGEHVALSRRDFLRAWCNSERKANQAPGS